MGYDVGNGKKKDKTGINEDIVNDDGDYNDGDDNGIKSHRCSLKP